MVHDHCVAMLSGKAPNGSTKLNLAVSSSITSIVNPSCSTRPASLFFSKSNLTVSALSGVPSWNVIPGRSFTVHWVASAFGSMLSAR